MKHTLLIIEDTLDLDNPPMQALMCVLGPGKAYKFSDVSSLDGFDRVMICAFPGSGEKVLEFVVENISEFDDRPTALINLCDKANNPAWMPEVSALLGCQSKQTAVISLHAPLEAFLDFALAFRADDHQPSSDMPGRDLEASIEDFLNQHNTCTLSTSYRGRARATTLEYRYADGTLYCVSEGGEKFAGILKTGYVSLAIYEPFSGFDRVAGMQMMGRPYVPVFGSETYQEAIHKYGLTMQKVNQLSVLLHVIEIRLDEVIFLWSGFSENGYNVRQVFRF